VPVGEDQRQHLELAREIVRKWNARFGATFVEPEPLFSSTPKILGLDGQAKMSKSLGNTISLREAGQRDLGEAAVAATDPARVRAPTPAIPTSATSTPLHRSSPTRSARRGAHRLHHRRHRLHRLQEWLFEG
jgi:tryptophanyl-tRNA synthetase